jgi:hypothetical protein
MTPQIPTPSHTAALDTLITLGTSLAKILHDAAAHQADALRTAHPAPNAPALDDLAAAFDQVARATRRAVALAHHLATPRPARPARDPAPAPDPETRRIQARERVIRTVEDAIERHAAHHPTHPDTPDSLYDELAERLDDPAFDAAIATTPIETLIQDLTRDLGVAMQGTPDVVVRRTPADIRAMRDLAARTPAHIPAPTRAPARPQPH